MKRTLLPRIDLSAPVLLASALFLTSLAVPGRAYGEEQEKAGPTYGAKLPAIAGIGLPTQTLTRDATSGEFRPTTDTSPGADPDPLLSATQWKEGDPLKVQVLEFSAAWCPPCKKSIPALDYLQTLCPNAGLLEVADPKVSATFRPGGLTAGKEQMRKDKAELYASYYNDQREWPDNPNNPDNSPGAPKYKSTQGQILKSRHKTVFLPDDNKKAQLEAALGESFDDFPVTVVLVNGRIAYHYPNNNPEQPFGKSTHPFIDSKSNTPFERAKDGQASIEEAVNGFTYTDNGKQVHPAGNGKWSCGTPNPTLVSPPI